MNWEKTTGIQENCNILNVCNQNIQKYKHYHSLKPPCLRGYLGMKHELHSLHSVIWDWIVDAIKEPQSNSFLLWGKN